MNGSWFNFNNLELALGMALKFYTSVGKGLKLKVRTLLGIDSYVGRSYKGKTGRGIGGGLFPMLNEIKGLFMTTKHTHTTNP